jgi:gliding motility-associated-like protein
MKKIKPILLLIISLISLSIFSQSLTNKTIEELETMKKEAISSENYDLANKINEEQKTRVSIDDKIKELDKKLKIAVTNENFDEAEKLKNEIKKLEEKKVTINRLEEEKKAAILVEDFDKVIALDKQIKDLKSDRKPEQVNSQTSANVTNTQQIPPVNNPQTSTYTTVVQPTSQVTPNSMGISNIMGMKGLVSMATQIQANAVILTSREVTPNGDGVNDFLTFQNLEKYPNNTLIITGKKGVSPYQITNYQNNWGGENHVAGTYYYNLRINGGKPQKGTFILKK